MNALPFEFMRKTGEPLMQFKGRALITPVFLHCCHKGYWNSLCNALMIFKETDV
jgi:hypothetical protein